MGLFVRKAGAEDIRHFWKPSRQQLSRLCIRIDSVLSSDDPSRAAQSHAHWQKLQ
jgi:hypothetical protein